MKKLHVKKTSKSGKSLYVIVACCALLLAWIVNKDINIPSFLIISFSTIGCLSLILYGVRKPEIPLYVLVGYLPFNATIAGTFGGFMTALNLTNILILITLFCWMVNRGKGGRDIEYRAGGAGRRLGVRVQSGFHWLVVLFCFFGIFSVMRGGFYYGSRYFMEFIIPLKRWLTPVFLYFLTFIIVKDREILKKTVVIIMIVVAIAGLLSIKESIDIGDTGSLDSSRVGGLAEQPNMMGAFFVYYMFLFMGFFYLNWHKIKSWGFLIPFLICLRGIQVTYSRGALMAFAFGLVAITFFKNKLIFFVMCLGIVFALLNPQFLPGGMRYAIDRTKGGEQIYESTAVEDTLDRSSATRVEIWKGAVQIIKDNPLWGVGYGVFPYVISYYVPGIGERDAHNTYLIIAAEMGIIVLIIFLLILFVLLKNVFWLYARTKDLFIKSVMLGMIGGLSGGIVVNMFGSRMNSEEVSSYFWILAGLVIRAIIMKKKGEIT